MKNRISFEVSFFMQFKTKWLYFFTYCFSLFFLTPFNESYGQTATQLLSIKNKALNFKYKVEYDSAALYFEELVRLTGKLGDNKQYLLAKIELSDIYILKRQYDNAYNELYETTEQIQTYFKEDKDLEADLYQVTGSYFLAKGMSDSAKTYLIKSLNLRISKNGNGDTLLHYVYNKLGNLYLSNSNYDSAYYYHKKALDISLKKQNEINFLSASSYQNLAIASHLKGDYNQAEFFYTKSLQFKEKLFSANDPGMAKIYGNLGKFFCDLNKYDSALLYYDKSEQSLLSRYDRNNILFAHLYWNKGNVYMLKGDYVKSASYLVKAYSILEENFGNDDQLVLKILLDLGFTYNKLGDKTLAIEYYHKAAKNKNDAGIIKIYRNLGNIYQDLNQPDSADKYYKLSIHFAKQFFSGESYDLALCYQYYGEFLYNNDDKEESLQFYLKAKEILTHLFDRKNKDLANVLKLESNYYLEKSNCNLALEKIQAALIALLPSFENMDPSSNPRMDEIVADLYLPNILNLKSEAYEKKYEQDSNLVDLYSSLNTINLTLDIIEEIRKTYLEEESQLLLNKEARAVIDLGITVTYELFKKTGNSKYVDEAFRFNEKGKSIILLSALRGLQAESTINIPKDAQDFEDNLARELATYGNMQYLEKQKKNPDLGKIELWDDIIFNLGLKHDSLMASYAKLYPDFFKLKYDYTIVSSDSIINFLPDDQAIIEYHLTDSLVFGFCFADKSLKVEKCGQKDDLINDLDSLMKNFIRQDYFNAGQQELDSIISVSSRLYDILIRPFKKDIEGKRLIIIPDGELGYLSFDLLLNKEELVSGQNYNQLPWLIKSNAISYSSSTTIYFEQVKSKPDKSLSDLLAFAPSYNFISNKRALINSDSLRINLSPITGTKEEIFSIAGFFRTKKRFDENATEDYFKKHAGNYSMLHLAMHTIIDNQNPLYSKLVFAPQTDSASEDGYLNTYELFRLKLPGNLVVLSACNTGSGKLERGEGIISLARGFFYAGIKSVVMTLWEIEDHSSANLMALFYEFLKNGDPYDIALQKAKISYMAKAGKLHSHPYFWAGYVNIGNTQPMIITHSRDKFYIILGSSISLILIVLIYFFINRRVFFRKK